MKAVQKISVVLLVTACVVHAAELDKAALNFFAPLPQVAEYGGNPVTDAKVTLGRKLFHDKRFSRSQTISCNSCHDLANYGVDGQATSEGFRGQRGARNSPTVFNAALHVAQFWDGRAADVEEQAQGPVLNPVEMAMADKEHVMAVINSIPAYRELFQQAFPGEADPVNYDNFGKAVGAFERRLLTPSRFDEFLNGNEDALTAAEKEGLSKFASVGCTACHNGVAVGGSMYQKLGLVRPWEGLKDDGRADFTKNEADRGFFKVPSLRNIEKTGPYLHDGSVKDLGDMVHKMAAYQLGKDLSDADVQSIVAFLRSLTGAAPPELVAVPELPPSGPDTPKPQG